jgi:hypothetical protein
LGEPPIIADTDPKDVSTILKESTSDDGAVQIEDSADVPGAPREILSHSPTESDDSLGNHTSPDSSVASSDMQIIQSTLVVDFHETISEKIDQISAEIQINGN